MRERSDAEVVEVVEVADPELAEVAEVKKKRLDLSVPQVAGSAVAAVVAAKLASYFGVYGTILGAGLVSVVATCGGSVFQHFFSRTGEQLREVTVTGRPGESAPRAPGEFTEGTVYRARVSSWKRPVVAAALVFGVTLTGITTYELVSGDSFSGGGGTTVSDAVTGHDPSTSKSRDDAPTSPTATPTPSTTPDVGAPSGSSGTSSDGGGATTTDPTPTPSASDGGGTPTPTPSASATTPTPDASSRSGSADPGQDGPAAP
ncbi:hypothetical protein ACIQI8_09190 [Streptomyces sp. NPDC092369]|uniref:hypothetical protein n=1 Tax=Streptomyces sp. NPDC092369 TaxID=3366015 RepID=UPI00382B4748